MQLYRAVNTLTFSFIKKTSQLKLYREIIALCSEIHIEQMNTLCGQNVEFLLYRLVILYIYVYLFKKVKQSRYRPGVAQRVPGT